MEAYDSSVSSNAPFGQDLEKRSVVFDTSRFALDLPRESLIPDKLRGSHKKCETMTSEDTATEQLVDPKQDLVIKLCLMGFPIAKVERVLLIMKSSTIEEALKYLVKGADGYWDHKLFPTASVMENNFADTCLLCSARQNSPSNHTEDTKVIQLDQHNKLEATNGLAFYNESYRKYSLCAGQLHQPYQYYNEAVGSTRRLNSSHACFLRSHPATDDDSCFICGDSQERHMPHLQSDDTVSFCELDQTCFTCSWATCAICLERDKLMTKLNCNHVFCTNCLKRYFLHCMDNTKQIVCPNGNCNSLIAEYLITSMVGLRNYENYICRLKELAIGSTAYCPSCSCLNEVPDALQPEVCCKVCFLTFCARCGTSWHKYKSCATYISDLYSFVCKNRQWQFCPKCKTNVKKGAMCGHMVCPSCLFIFCISCRKRLTSKVNDSEYCPFHNKLLNKDTNRNITALCATVILLLYLTIVPILALFLVPYIIGVNVYDYFAADSIIGNASQIDATVSRLKNSGNLNSLSDAPIYENNGGTYRCSVKGWVFGIVGFLLAILLSPLSAILLLILGLYKYLTFYL